MSLLWFCCLAALIIIACISIVNTLSFPRLNQRNSIFNIKKYSSPESGDVDTRVLEPFVSFLVPARNEEKRIIRTLRGIQSQIYVKYEIVVLDDNSTDSTFELVSRLAQIDDRIRVFPGQALPPGWVGKNWACHQLAEKARGEILVFTDADVDWLPQALTRLIQLMHHYRADALTVWPTQKSVSWAERLVVPLMNFAIIGYLPEIFVRIVPWPVFSAAIGQAFAFRREVYELIGGHQLVWDKVVEDIALAMEIKRQGFRLVMALGSDLISTRMYHNWNEVREGFAKLFIEGLGGKPFLVITITLIHLMLFLVPWLWLALGYIIPQGGNWPVLPLAMIVVGVAERALCAAVSNERVQDAIFLPLSMSLMTIIVCQALWWHYRYGGPRWKGRQVSTRIHHEA
jgi:chlorobactene glucosyltransferase